MFVPFQVYSKLGPEVGIHVLMVKILDIVDVFNLVSSKSCYLNSFFTCHVIADTLTRYYKHHSIHQIQ